MNNGVYAGLSLGKNMRGGILAKDNRLAGTCGLAGHHNVS